MKEIQMFRQRSDSWFKEEDKVHNITLIPYRFPPKSLIVEIFLLPL